MNIKRAKTVARVAALAILASAGAPSLAKAVVASDVRSEVVRFDDLNLGSQAGVHALYARIESAAREVCGPAESTALGVAAALWRDCVSASLHDAVLKVKHPALTAYYTDRLRASAFKRTG